MPIAIRWILAALLWIAVLAVMERARRRQVVRVYGPDGATMLVPRGDAERLAQMGRLRRAPDEVMRQDLGLPPRIGTDVTTDHTRLAGAVQE